MPDYIDSININDYAYRQNIYIEDGGSCDKIDIQLKLELNDNNFNFLYANSDGSDLRLALNSNGTGVLPIWIQSWDSSNKSAVIWFKLPKLFENETKIVYVFWGNENAPTVSDIDNLSFLLSDSFEDTTTTGTSSQKWDGWGGAFITKGDSYINLGSVGASPSYITYKNSNLIGYENWYLETNLLLINSASFVGNYLGFYLTAIENSISFSYAGNYVEHSILYSDTMESYPEEYYGLTLEEHSSVSLSYYEPTDTCTYKVSSNNFTVDTERRCNGDTRLSTFRFYSGTNGSCSTNIYDILIKKYYGPYEPTIDLSELYVEYQNVVQPTDDGISYNKMTTSVLWNHSSIGGDTNNLFDNDINTDWVSDYTSTYSGTITIDTKAGVENIATSSSVSGYFESSYIGFLNAQKLFDDDLDVNNNNYWLCTTNSGYAGISFSESRLVNSFRLKAVSDLMDGCPLDYKFYGGNFTNIIDPFSDKTLLVSGTLLNTSALQAYYFDNKKVYDYYYIDVLNTQGDDPVAIQELRLFEGDYDNNVTVSKIKLKPSINNEDFKYLPRHIELYGSNDMINWTKILNTTSTYTPVNKDWQSFVFNNYTDYNIYKVVLLGNWANSTANKFTISELEVYSKVLDDSTYFILKGNTNDFNNIHHLDSVFAECGFYVTNNIVNIVVGNSLSDYTVFNNPIIDIDT